MSGHEYNPFYALMTIPILFMIHNANPADMSIFAADK